MTAPTPEQRDLGFLVGTCAGVVLGAVPAAFVALAEMTQVGRARVEWVVCHTRAFGRPQNFTYRCVSHS